MPDNRLDFASLEQYINEHTENDDALYVTCLDLAVTAQLNLNMMSDHAQGVLFTMLTKLLQPKIVVEVGTFVAFATACFAKGLNLGAKIISLESNDSLQPLINKVIKSAQVEDKVEIIFGDANKTLDKIPAPIDLSFIDADKGNYWHYYEKILAKTRQGGCILVDNVLWKHKVLNPDEYQGDTNLIHIQEFNSKIKHDTRIEKVILPIRDGVFLLRKK